MFPFCEFSNSIFFNIINPISSSIANFALHILDKTFYLDVLTLYIPPVGFIIYKH